MAALPASPLSRAIARRSQKQQGPSPAVLHGLPKLVVLVLPRERSARADAAGRRRCLQTEAARAV